MDLGPGSRVGIEFFSTLHVILTLNGGFMSLSCGGSNLEHHKPGVSLVFVSFSLAGMGDCKISGGKSK